MMTEGNDNSRKAAAVLSVLQGSAREYGRSIPPDVLVRGGVINGVQTDPLTFLMYQLSTRFARLGEEISLGTIAELMSFKRE